MMIGNQPTRSARPQGQTALQGQTQRQKKLEQAAEKVEQLIMAGTQAKTSQEKLLRINQILEEAKKTVAQDTVKPHDQRSREVQLADRLLAENKAMRNNVDSRKKVSDPQQYSRPVTQAEEVSMNMLMGDLVHPDADQARKARERLKALGVEDALLDAITEEMKKTRAKGKTKAVQFGGGHNHEQTSNNPFGTAGSTGSSLHDLMRAVRQQITAHSDRNAILNAGCDQQLDMLHHAVKPLLFGSGAWVVTDYDHNGYPVTEWSNNGP